MRYRDLDTGTFLTRDPIGYADGPNIYCYVHCNPITRFDPVGLNWQSFCQNAQDKAMTAFQFAAGTVVGYAEGLTGISAKAPTSQAELAGRSGGRGAAAATGLALMGHGGQTMSTGVALAVPALAAGPETGGATIVIDGVVILTGTAEVALGGIITKNVTSLDPLKMESSATEQSGGRHGDMQKPTGDGLDSHHMPDRNADPNVSVDDGPAIQMDPADHRATSSYGGGRAATQYRSETATMYSSGQARDAMAREIKDVRNAAKTVSGDQTKYNKPIKEMLDYAKDSGQL